jgi:hypothetical protein
MLVVPKTPGSLLLLGTLQTARISTVGLKLYTNDFSPSLTTVLGDFTEATYAGYNPAGTIVSFTPPALNAGGKAEIVYTNYNSFVSAPSGNTIYGYYVIDNFDPSKLLWAERLPSPIRMQLIGDSISIVVRFTLLSELSG